MDDISKQIAEAEARGAAKELRDFADLVARPRCRIWQPAEVAARLRERADAIEKGTL